MASARDSQFAEVLNQVSQWPPNMQAALAREILSAISSPAVSAPARARSLDQVVGLLDTGQPPPSDQECRDIVEQERLRKHG